MKTIVGLQDIYPKYDFEIVYWYSTQCPYKCPYCVTRDIDEPKQEIFQDAWVSLFSAISKYRPGLCLSFVFTGKEATCDPALFVDLLHVASAMKYAQCHSDSRIVIQTNLQCNILELEKLAQNICVADLPIVFSITGNSCSEVKLTKQGIDYYKSLEDKWDYIVPRQGHAIQSEFQALDVSRYEVLLNGRCIPGCTFWLKHFGKIAEVNRLYSNPYQQLGQEACENLYRHCYYDNQFDIEAVNTVQIMSGVSSMFIQAFRNGITRFKIAGRTMTDEVLREDLHFYYDQSMKELKNV